MGTMDEELGRVFFKTMGSFQSIGVIEVSNEIFKVFVHCPIRPELVSL